MAVTIDFTGFVKGMVAELWCNTIIKIINIDVKMPQSESAAFLQIIINEQVILQTLFNSYGIIYNIIKSICLK